MNERAKKRTNIPEYDYQTEVDSLPEKTFLSIIQKIINIYPFFVLVIDEDHNIVLINDKVLGALGKNMKDIIGCYCPKAIHSIDEPFPGCPLQEAIEKDHYVEIDLLDPFYEKWVSSAIYPIEYKTRNGKKLFLHTACDITERKKAEETIHQQNKFLESLLESLTQPFYVIDANDYTVKMANSASNFGDLTENSKCFRLTHKKNRPCNDSLHPCTIDEIKKTGKSVVVEHNHYVKDGINRLFEVHGYPIFDKDGNITQIIEYTLDITKRKQAEKKLIKIQNDLEVKSNNLEERNIALKVLLELQEEEKKNIQSSILGNFKTLVYPYIEKLMDTSLTESQTTLLNIIESNLLKVMKPFSTLLMDKLVKLSPTEVRIANLVRAGKTAKEIAQIMYITENTVKAHYRSIRSKLGIKNKKINMRAYLQSIVNE